MPTNKLWLEHTERAAWESVEALREKLAQAEKRVEKLAPPIEGWAELLAALDELREERGLESKSYAELMRALDERATRARSAAQALEAELARERERRALPEPALPSARFERSELPNGVLDEDDEYDAGTGAELLRSVWRRYRVHLREHARTTPDGLLHAIESEVDRLGELDEPELADAALSLAVLALRLERAARQPR